VVDAQESVRAQVGMTANVYRDLDASDTVYVVGEVPTQEAFEEMSKDTAVAEIQKAAGVISEPILTLLEKVVSPDSPLISEH